jgi:hypothetical protein
MKRIKIANDEKNAGATMRPAYAHSAGAHSGRVLTIINAGGKIMQVVFSDAPAELS